MNADKTPASGGVGARGSSVFIMFVCRHRVRPSLSPICYGGGFGDAGGIWSKWLKIGGSLLCSGCDSKTGQSQIPDSERRAGKRAADVTWAGHPRLPRWLGDYTSRTRHAGKISTWTDLTRFAGENHPGCVPLCSSSSMV